jgi:hypothetical protein
MALDAPVLVLIEVFTLIDEHLLGVGIADQDVPHDLGRSGFDEGA